MARKTSAGEYIRLLKPFVGGEILATAFEDGFWELHHAGDWPDGSFPILDPLFYFVDAFHTDPALRDDDVDEERLRQECDVALKKFLDLERHGGC